MNLTNNMVEEIKKIKLKHVDVYLENFDYGQGKITLTNPYRGSFSHYWGSMGGK